MASSNSSKSPMLPISDPPRPDDKVFKGSAMSKRGAYAAISYMSCAGALSSLNCILISCEFWSRFICVIIIIIIIILIFSLIDPFYVNSSMQFFVFAVLLVIFNKAALSSYHFPCASVITLFQVDSWPSFFFSWQSIALYNQGVWFFHSSCNFNWKLS